MDRVKRWGIGVAVALGLVLVAVGTWKARWVLVRFVPYRHEGVVHRIGTFHKGLETRFSAPTRQSNQFAIVFEDGYNCEGFDTSFAAVKAGDRIEIIGYPDVKGWPVLDPEWWECDEAQLVRFIPTP